VACAVADIKVLPLAYEPKAEERYLLEPLHFAAIAQLPRVCALNGKYSSLIILLEKPESESLLCAE